VIKRTLQFIAALILALIIFVIVVIMTPYLAMQSAWEIVTGEGETNRKKKRKGDD